MEGVKISIDDGYFLKGEIMKNNELWILIDEEGQEKILSLLETFNQEELEPDKENYFYPLVVNFDKKSVRRCTSNLACSCAATSGLIIRYDLDRTLDLIEEKLHEIQPEK